MPSWYGQADTFSMTLHLKMCMYISQVSHKNVWKQFVNYTMKYIISCRLKHNRILFTLRALMTIGSNNLMYEANDVLSAPWLKPLNADPFLSDFRRKEFIHLKNKKILLSSHLQLSCWQLIIQFMPHKKECV